MGGILHVAYNAHLQQHAFEIFEKYYPGKNIMVMLPPEKGDVVKIKLTDRSKIIDYRKENTYGDILDWCKSFGVDKIMLHSLTYGKVKLVEYLKQYIECKVYWLFWGYDLYEALGEDFGVSLVDEKFNPFRLHTYYYPNKIKGYILHLKYGKTKSDVIKRGSEVVDYFCFWNKYDYELYVKYFGDKVKYKFFGYICNEKKDAKDSDSAYVFPRKSRSIILNHQASRTGNHITVMRKIKKIDSKGIYSVYVPLSYGDSHIRRYCMRMGKKLFGEKFVPITEYLSLQEYYKIIDVPETAIFGQKRQEATGNIGHLLTVGTKVFLRQDNPLFKYFKDKGYYIFSFEQDLKTLEDLNGLSEEQMIHNRQVWSASKTYYDDFMINFFEE